ncbi:hypothetical protein E2926_18305 [Escherichia coli]|nr:hypothetical protein [Escherichia coli]HAX2076675.1 tail fiber assembly protein [Escherichia coli]
MPIPPERVLRFSPARWLQWRMSRLIILACRSTTRPPLTRWWRTELMLGEISDANRAKLSAWLTYKNDVKATDVTTDPENINWPVPPEV